MGTQRKNTNVEQEEISAKASQRDEAKACSAGGVEVNQWKLSVKVDLDGGSELFKTRMGLGD